MTYATVPRLWPGSTIVCVGTGPSLTHEDVDFCRDRARLIVVNDAYAMAPWADVMYAADGKFWRWCHQSGRTPDEIKRRAIFKECHGLKYSIEPSTAALSPVLQILRNTGRHGLELHPNGLRTGYNSGYQAINLAVHLGASRILLLGLDMKDGPKRQAHFFGAHPDQSKPPYSACLGAFDTLVKPLAEAGVSIVNCTPGSALRCFPMAPLREQLAEAA